LKIALIVNPKASAYSDKARAACEAAFRDGNDLTVTETLYRGHGIDLAREAASAGSAAVAVLGGDGTLNEVANGLAGTDAALVPLPGGSTNVLARTVGYHRKLKKALPQAQAALQKPPQRIGLGLVNGRYFTFHVGMGYDAAVVAKVEQKPDLKRKIGQGVFVYAALATWTRTFDRTAPHLQVRVGDGMVVDDGYFAICLNSNPYTYLGVRPLNAAPGHAAFDQPLVLVTLRTLRLFKFLPLIGSTLGSGAKLQRSPHVDYRPGLDAVTVAAAANRSSFAYQADGDYLGEAEQLAITYEPDRLLLIVP
jgi:diacylglycerol kinase family enzyme